MENHKTQHVNGYYKGVDDFRTIGDYNQNAFNFYVIIIVKVDTIPGVIIREKW